jgi:hypothetical protein
VDDRPQWTGGGTVNDEPDSEDYTTVTGAVAPAEIPVASSALFFLRIDGFPDQPIMEDCNIMDLLRRGAKLL